MNRPEMIQRSIAMIDRRVASMSKTTLVTKCPANRRWAAVYGALSTTSAAYVALPADMDALNLLGLAPSPP
jgi:hypothetical protein